MKPLSFVFLMLLMVLCFCSCQSYRTIEIATYNPAAITFPSEVRTVMIVNNAAQQPYNSLLQDLNEQAKDSAFSLSADSLAYYFCLSLGKAIAESPVFDDVRLSNDTFRTDSIFLISRPFTQYEVRTLCDICHVDALISLDRLYFKNAILKRTQNNYFNWNYLSIIITGELKALCPGYQTALTIPFTDSLQWATEESVYYNEVYKFTAEDIHTAMRYLSEFVGEKMHTHFVPYWDDEERWFYTKITSDWKRATINAIAGKWDAAAAEWHPLFDKAKKWELKAKLASNLALYYEIKGDFHRAIEYAETANTLFKNNTAEDDKYREMQQSYLETLTKRAEDDEKLSLQLRE